jgi:hypothetical protein
MAKITLQGVVGPTPWATSLWFQRTVNTVPTGTAIDDFLTAVKGLYLAGGFPAAFGELNATTTTLGALRVDFYQSSSAVSVSNGTVTGMGGVGTVGSQAPASTAVVATLLTSLMNRSGRGRMYFPATAAIAGANGYLLTTASCSDLAGALADFIDDVNGSEFNDAVGVLTAVVRSLHNSAVNPITSVRVDNRPDRQEHREKNLVPSRSIANIS